MFLLFFGWFFHCLLVLSLSLPLLVPFANFVFALFLISLTVFHLFCWLGSFVLFLFWIFSFCFAFFSLCVLFLFSLSLTLSDKKLQISCLCVRFFVHKNIYPFCQVSFFWNSPFFKHSSSFLHVVATLCVQSLLLVFSFLVRGEGRVQKHTSWNMLFILSLFLNPSSFSPFSLSVFVSFFYLFWCSFHPKNKKFLNCVFICVSHHFLLKLITKMFSHFFSSVKTKFQKINFTLFSIFVFILCFCIFNIKEKFSLSCLRPLFVLLCISSDFSLFFIFDVICVFISFFSFSFFTLFSVYFSCLCFSFLLVIFLSFFAVLCTFTSPVLCFRLFEPKKKRVLTCLLVFFDPFFWFSFPKRISVSFEKTFLFQTLNSKKFK